MKKQQPKNHAQYEQFDQNLSFSIPSLVFGLCLQPDSVKLVDMQVQDISLFISGSIENCCDVRDKNSTWTIIRFVSLDYVLLIFVHVCLYLLFVNPEMDSLSSCLESSSKS